MDYAREYILETHKHDMIGYLYNYCLDNEDTDINKIIEINKHLVEWPQNDPVVKGYYIMSNPEFNGALWEAKGISLDGSKMISALIVWDFGDLYDDDFPPNCYDWNNTEYVEIIDAYEYDINDQDEFEQALEEIFYN